MRVVNFIKDKRVIAGQDAQLNFRILGEEWFKLTASAAKIDSAIEIEPAKYELDVGARIYFERQEAVIVVTASVSLGDTSISCAPLVYPLRLGDYGYKIEDVRTWSVRWRMQNPDLDETKLTKLNPDDIDVLSDGINGVATVTLLAADTSDDELTPLDDHYHHDLWRTNTSNTVPLLGGTLQLAET